MRACVRVNECEGVSVYLEVSVHQTLAVQEVDGLSDLEEDLQTLGALPLVRTAALGHPVLQRVLTTQLHLDVQVHLETAVTHVTTSVHLSPQAHLLSRPSPQTHLLPQLYRRPESTNTPESTSTPVNLPRPSPQTHL